MSATRSLCPSADMNAAGRGANLERIGELDPHLLRVLALHGYDTLEKLRAAGDVDLLELVGVDPEDVARIREVVGR